MSPHLTSMLKSVWHAVVRTVRWIVALVRVALRYSWRTKVAFFCAPATGSFDEFRRVYGNYHRSMFHLLLGDIESALEDPPPPYPDQWGF